MREVRSNEANRKIGHLPHHVRIGGSDNTIIHVDHTKHEYRILHFLIGTLDSILCMVTAATITIIFLYSANIYAVKFIVASCILLTFPILIIIYNGLDQLYIHKTDELEKKYIVTWGVMHAVIIVVWLMALFLVNVNYNLLVNTSAMSGLVWVD